MVSSNNDIIREDINRLNELVSKYSSTEEALADIVNTVSFAANKLNTAWKSYQVMAVLGEKERSERDDAIVALTDAVQHWLVEIITKAPELNVKNIPNTRATLEDTMALAEDLILFFTDKKGELAFAGSAMLDITEKLNNTKKEISEAQAIMPLEAECRYTYTEACVDANTVLKMSLDIVRTVFGRTSPEYRQFLEHNTPKDNKTDIIFDNYAAE